MTSTASAPTTTSVVAVPIGAPCRVCTMDPDHRRQVEAALGTSASLRSIALNFGISRSSLSRHLHNHLSDAVRQHLERDGRLSAISIATALLDLVETAHDVRQDAADRGQERLALRATMVETHVRRVLADRLGISDQAAMADLRAADAVARAVTWAAQQDAHVAHAIADALVAIDAHSLAFTFRAMAPREKKHA